VEHRPAASRHARRRRVSDRSARVASHHFEIANNLFIGPATLTGTRVVDWIAPIDDARIDFNGYFPDAAFRFNLMPGGFVSYGNFAAMQADGVLEANGTVLTPPIFDSGLVAPASYTTSMAPADVIPTATSEAVDSATPLPNVATPYHGSAPDRGAVERGCPSPIYGVRPLGIDESNEPLGCP
jgi:hypothetical protein